MRYVAAREPGPPDVLALAEGRVPQPQGRRGADRGEPRRRQPARLPAARRDTIRRRPMRRRSSASRSPARSSRCGEGVTRLARRRSRLRADAGRRLRRVLHDAGRRSACRFPRACRRSRRRACRRTTSPSGTTCSTAAACARGETVLIHGGSSGIGLAAIQLAKAVRRDRDHDRRQRRQGGVLPRRSAPTTRSTTGRRTSSPRSRASPASAASTSSSTWSAATTSRRT